MASREDLPGCEPTDACYRAVTTAYRRLRECGQTDVASFNAALAVFRHHHPAVPPSRAPYVVAEWID